MAKRGHRKVPNNKFKSRETRCKACKGIVKIQKHYWILDPGGYWHEKCYPKDREMVVDHPNYKHYLNWLEKGNDNEDA